MFSAYNDQQVVTLAIIATFVIGGPLFVIGGGIIGYLFRQSALKRPVEPHASDTRPA